MFKVIEIASHQGSYCAAFGDLFEWLARETNSETHFIIDRKIAKHYAKPLSSVLTHDKVLLVEACEENKSLGAIPDYVELLVQQKIRRNHQLVAIGGGVIQDITCFLAATILRGVDWKFVPTTLLAQADSCIGSKSSINCGQVKNILGTFTPPKNVLIDVNFLKSLDDVDMFSGIGEMLKVHALDSEASLYKITADYPRLLENPSLLQDYLYASLLIKKRYIEEDEFDKGIRNHLNYGHTFGHAIETATDFTIPHGIAVTMGMDMANYVSYRLGQCDEGYYRRHHVALKHNYILFSSTHVDFDKFVMAISKDKKAVSLNTLNIIIPQADDTFMKFSVANDQEFQRLCADYLESERVS